MGKPHPHPLPTRNLGARAATLIEEVDARQNAVLDQLDDLNAEIESVIAYWLRELGREAS